MLCYQEEFCREDMDIYGEIDSVFKQVIVQIKDI